MHGACCSDGIRRRESAMEQLRQTILSYAPCNAAEEADRQVMLESMDRFSDLLTRENRICHMTASAWVVNPERTKVLMVYHNIYRSWSWTGGHADGEEDLAAVALREVREETGVSKLRLLSEAPFSLEILTVAGHTKRGKRVNPHLHFNLTYLIEAEESEELIVKPDENSGVAWLTFDEVINKCTEPEMIPIYEKLNRKLQTSDL